MKQFFITGTSSGIGRALAEKALAQGHRVIGISRRNNLRHENYQHLSCDLSDYRNYKLVNFDRNRSATETVLINNAGWLGEVKPLGQIPPSSIERAFQVNLIAPSILTKLFIEQTEGKLSGRVVINITSGAARYPVASWSTYCSTKAGLDMLTRVMAIDHPDIRFMAIAPGIVDTEMQGEIRQLEKSDFPEVERFKEYKTRGELSQPNEVANKILQLLSNSAKTSDIVFSLRDLD